MHGLYVLWWVRERHVSVAAVAVILAAGDLAVSLLELPTGWLADRCGHRVSLITGSLFQIAGMLFAWLGAGIPGVLASSLLIAAGDAFRSGADQALLYRSCAAVGEAAFQRIEARSRSLQLASLVALVLAGGAIVEAWGFSAGWLVETTLSVAGLAIACAMVEPPPLPDDASAKFEAAAYATARERPRIGHLKTLAALIVPAAILGSVASAAAFLVQAAADIEPARMTAFVATVTLAEAAGTYAGGRLTAGARGQLIVTAVGLVIATVAAVVPALFLPGVIVLCFLMGVVYPLRAGAIQRVAADHLRARAASLASACDKAFMTIALIAAGGAKRR